MAIPRKDARQVADGPRAKSRARALQLHRDWEEELATNEMDAPHLSPTKKLELEEGLTRLVARHPGLDQEARQTTYPPKLSPAAGAKLQAKRGAARLDEQVARAAASTRSSAARVSRSAYRQSGIPAAGSDWTRTTLQLLGGMVGVSLLYLVLSNASSRGPGNVPQALWAGAAAFRRLFSPDADILAGGKPITDLLGRTSPLVPFSALQVPAPEPRAVVPKLGGVSVKALSRAGLIGPLHLGTLTVPIR